MIGKSDFDNIIKENLEKHYLGASFGYKISDKENKEKCFDNYYTNKAFDNFVEEMKSSCYMQHYKKYGAGKGGELKESDGKNGATPPKMASVASSSRFCYLALRNGGQAIGANGPVMFEVGCKIEGLSRIPPQLDAWFPEENIFMEVKCHEIFDSHTPVLKKAYWDLIYGEKNKFGFPVVAENCDQDFKIPLTEFKIDKTSSMFDIKQFLCHLLGIASKKNALEIPATLMYLFFIPKTDNDETNARIKEVFSELKKEIDAVFESAPIKAFTKENNIKLAAVAECDYIMRDLTKENKVVLYKSEGMDWLN